MIISTLRRFIFVAIPKTGTHSVRQALRKHMGASDMEQVGLFVRRQLPIPALAQLQHGHLSLAQVKPYMTAEAFGSLFKFAFVRNPFDRFVSYCAFMARNGDAFATRPKDVMRHYLSAPRHDHVLFQPQHGFVTGPDGELLTDFVGKVEQMQQSYDEICARIGIPSEPLDKLNSTSRADYRTYYDQELIDGVAKLYGRDISLFGYEF